MCGACCPALADPVNPPRPQNYGVTPGSAVWAYSPCHPDDKNPAQQNEAWTMEADGSIKEISTGLCLDTYASASFSQTPIIINTCSGVPTQQVCGVRQE